MKFYTRGYMSLFSLKKSSMIRDWANRQRKTANIQDDLRELLFESMMFGASQFDGKALELANAPYAGDSTLFELACYFLHETNLWLHKNRPEIREEVFTYIFQRLITIFEEALKVNYQIIGRIALDRMHYYREIANNGNDTKDYLELLCELMRRTKNNKHPQKYDEVIHIDKSLDLFGDFMGLEMSVTIFLSHMLPVYYDVLKNFINLIEKNNKSIPS